MRLQNGGVNVPRILGKAITAFFRLIIIAGNRGFSTVEEP